MLLVALSISACTSIAEETIASHGYVPTEKDIAYIKRNRPSKQQISIRYTKPFTVSTFDKNQWYYMAYRTSQYAFFKKEYIDFKIVKLTFKNNRVAKVDIFDKQALHKIQINPDKTKTSGKELGVIEQMLGNVGKFVPKDNQDF